jgi:(4S)-4-hydroxy-5-phosphonooxypentane-2,3-dione isomerase
VVVDDSAMLVVHVHVQVLAAEVEAFIAATRSNALESLQEPGMARFDVVQQADDPTRFVLIEAYKTADAPARHKETAHYAAWRDAVAPMMASPRTSVKYQSLCPEEARWGTVSA